jgi:hypothetical protein
MSAYGWAGECHEIHAPTANLCTREHGHKGDHEHENERGEITDRWTCNPEERRAA